MAISADQAREILARCNARNIDFHTLSSEQVEMLLASADAVKYRKPRNANGSRGRYFHAYLSRLARRESRRRTVEALSLRSRAVARKGLIMAWKVYDSFPSVFGPLACKRWERDGQRYTIKHKVTPAWRDVRDAEAKRAADLARAVKYARWLAARDGIVIPDDCEGVPITELVTVPDLKRPELRVCEVRFVRRFPNKRVDPSDVRAVIAIPHWDWVPVAVDETELDFRLAAY